MDLLAYFRAEVDIVGRHWREILATFDDQTALVRPASGMNHALWLTGHMTWAEDYLILEVPKGINHRLKEWDQFFDHSSEKLAPEEYPPWQEVKAEYTRVHGEVIKALALLTVSELSKASSIEKRWFPTAAHSIAHQVTHGHYHLGQLVYLNKLRQEDKT